MEFEAGAALASVLGPAPVGEPASNGGPQAEFHVTDRISLLTTLKHEAIPYIPFKSNSKPSGSTYGAKSTLWTLMFHFYMQHREEFLTHYHKRSNVESTFSMIKRKFGDFLRSKTDVAMLNEALAKILCHNICCLIQAMYELGVEPEFWAGNPSAQKGIDLHKNPLK